MEQTPRRWLVTHEYAPFRGGVATYCEEAAHAWTAAGNTVRIVTTGNPSSAPETPRQEFEPLRCGGHLSSLRLGSLIRWGRGLWLHRHLFRDGVVVVASVGGQFIGMVFQAFGIRLWRRYRVLFHGSEVSRFNRSPLWRRLAPAWLDRAEEILAASPFAREQLLQSGLLAPERQVRLALCGVKQRLRLEALAHSAAPPRPSRPQGELQILTLARLHPRKGQDHTVQALGLLPEPLKSRIRYRLVGGGDPAFRAHLAELARSCGVRCEFTGEVAEDQLGECYRDCDIYVMSSVVLEQSVEGFGMTYLEAGLWSKPVVGYRSGGVEGAVVHEVTGLLAPCGDVEALSAAIARLASDSELRQRLGAAGRERALQFGWDATALALFGDQAAG